MILSQLHIHYLRAFNIEKFQFDPHFNYISGPNGCGKTSLLEAIYLLSCGHSFKTREISPLIQHDRAELVLFGQALESTVSISKSNHAPTIVKVDGQLCKSASQLAHMFPCQVYYQDIFQIMDAGPGIRRSMIDWGMFHVKHDYLSYWKKYKQLLKQRNSLLKSTRKKHELEPWDIQLSEVGEVIAEMRSNYIDELKDAYTSVLEKLSNVSVVMDYDKGWDKKGLGLSLKQSLQNSHDRDLKTGFTSVGIHQADIILSTGDMQAKKILSRGQQKVALIALKLTQSLLLKQYCIHLLDDIFAELDHSHQNRLAQYIADSDDQYFFTVLENDLGKLSYFPEGRHVSLSKHLDLTTI